MRAIATIVNEDFPKQLVDVRQRLRVSMRTVSEETKIPIQFIHAFEGWDFSGLGAEVYVRGFFEKYVRFLGLPLDGALVAFEEGWKGTHVRGEEGAAVPNNITRILFGEKTLAVCGAVFAIALVIGYLLYTLKDTIFPLSLTIWHPAADMVTTASAVEIEGTVAPETAVSLSGRPLYVDEHGEFKERIHLVSGVNALEFEAHNKFGKEKNITRYVLLKE